MDDEPTESLWMRIKDWTNTGDIVEGIWCRPPDQEKQVHEAFCGQLEVALRSQALMFMRDFNHTNIC